MSFLANLIRWGVVRKGTDAFGDTVLVGGDGVPVYLPAKVFSALLNKTADQAITKGGVSTKINWAGQSSALGGIVVWDAANPSRLTIPAGFSAAKITGQVRLDDAFANQLYANHIYKNGSLVYNGVGLPGDSVPVDGALVLPATSPWLPVSPGDYFELGTINTNATTDNWVLGTVRTWVSIELAK